nr:hypothetical protein [Tanacetum cinerariifolium]
MPITRQGTSNNMTPEAVRAMIDQTRQRNSINGELKVLLACPDGLRKWNQYSILTVAPLKIKPKTLDEAIELVNDLMDQKLRTYTERQTESKMKFDNNNQALQLLKRQNMAQAYAVGHSKKVDHLIRDCWNPTFTSNQKTITCYECGNQGHYKSDCLELKNRNHVNQAEGTGARGMVYALEGRETNQDLDDIKNDINA